MDHGLIGPPIAYADLDQDVGRRCLRIFHEDVEIPVTVEYAGVEQFVLGILAATTPIRLYQVKVRKFLLRILIEILHV